MAEPITLDPSEVATDRVELPISEGAIRVTKDGPDWEDAQVQAYMSEQASGSVPVDFRIPNRTAKIPLAITATTATAFKDARRKLQQKVGLLQREGGWVKRGAGVYADVVNASLALPDKYGYTNSEIDVVLTLELIPDFYGDEIALDDIAETTNPELVSVLKQSGSTAVIKGDYPGRCRIVVDEDQGADQLGLIYGIRSRRYSAAATAQLVYPAQSLTPLDQAANATVGSRPAVRHQNLASSWTPTLGTNLTAGSPLTHEGSYRVYAYAFTTSAAVDVRLVWDVGDIVLPAENPPARLPGVGNWYLIDLGEVRLDRAGGVHQWQGAIQSRGGSGGENVAICRVMFVPLDEAAGKAVAAPGSGLPPSGYLARDDFNQTAGSLAGKAADVGGQWSTTGATGDFTVKDGDHLVQRSTSNDVGRFAISGAAAVGNSLARIDVAMAGPSTTVQQGVGLRWIDANNYLLFYIVYGVSQASFVLMKKVGGTVTSIASGNLGYGLVSSTLRIQIRCSASGVWTIDGTTSGQNFLHLSGTDTDTAPSGALATGKPFFYDSNASSAAASRSYDNFAAYAPVSDAAIYATRSGELRHDGLFRQDVTGSALTRQSNSIGDYPRIPVSGVEGRPVELLAKLSRGDFGSLPDTAIDDLSARVYYRPSWLAPYSNA